MKNHFSFVYWLWFVFILCSILWRRRESVAYIWQRGQMRIKYRRTLVPHKIEENPVQDGVSAIYFAEAVTVRKDELLMTQISPRKEMQTFLLTPRWFLKAWLYFQNAKKFTHFSDSKDK